MYRYIYPRWLGDDIVCTTAMRLKWQKRASSRLVHSLDTLRYSPTFPSRQHISMSEKCHFGPLPPEKWPQIGAIRLQCPFVQIHSGNDWKIRYLCICA